MLGSRTTVLLMEESPIHQNSDRITCKILAAGANAPTTLKATEILNEKGVFITPDILANTGYATVSYFERGPGMQNYMWFLQEINDRLHLIISEAFQRTYLRSQNEHVDMRTAATIEGIERVTQAKLSRGVFP